MWKETHREKPKLNNQLLIPPAAAIRCWIPETSLPQISENIIWKTMDLSINIPGKIPMPLCLHVEE
jgi:hypothetical protein